MSSDTRGTGRGPDKQNGHDQEAEVAEYQRHLDATSESPDDSEGDSQSEEAAEWADRHPRDAGAVGDPGDKLNLQVTAPQRLPLEHLVVRGAQLTLVAPLNSTIPMP
jgi:hypothetical protein